MGADFRIAEKEFAKSLKRKGFFPGFDRGSDNVHVMNFKPNGNSVPFRFRAPEPEPMAIFKKLKGKANEELTLQLMQCIEEEPDRSQRNLASELGIALGMLNAYLRRCAKKGWIKINRISAKKLSYCLTPEGFVEKSRIVSNFLVSSLAFVKQARTECERVIAERAASGIDGLTIVGESELGEISALLANRHGIAVRRKTLEDGFANGETVLICDVERPQKIYNELAKKHPERLIVAPAMLKIKRG